MKVLLTTLHAKYSHASLALPCLAAICRDLADTELQIREWTVNEPREHLLRLIMAEQADLVAFSCYIWNIEKTLRIASDIKKISPGTLVVLGGPEASFGIFELMHDNPAIDFIVKGEGELPFRRLLETLASHRRDNLLEQKLAEIDNLFFRDRGDTLSGPLSRRHLTLDELPSPFTAGLVDLEKTLVYYETSRGCPFSCAFCLSSVEGSVRSFGMERIRSDLSFLMERNVPFIKLVDRTFNYDAERANAIWEYILIHNRGSHFHFEIAADLLTEANLQVLKRVPPDTFRFEIGVQSASSGVLEQVGRKADLQRIYEAVRRLRSETRVELHLDLLAGLPSEDYEGFLASLQAVAALEPHEIQIEPLKVLKGSPMREIAGRQDYSFSDAPPYIILRNPWLSFEEIGRIETIGRLLDLFYNQGGFSSALKLVADGIELSQVFDRMARQAGHENLSGFSTRRSYELFFRLARPLLGKGQGTMLSEALFYDYCRREMPMQGKLPGFFARRQQECAWPGRSELPQDLPIPPGSRVKAFRFTFSWDFRSQLREQRPTELLFAYVSGSGQGLRVLMV